MATEEDGQEVVKIRMTERQAKGLFFALYPFMKSSAPSEIGNAIKPYIEIVEEDNG